jgi:hypothetical protein
MVSWRDLVKEGGSRVYSRMTRPAATARPTDLLEAAGRLMAVTGYHHLVVVGDNGEAVGFLSLLDVMRGVLGIPAAHPEGFPHYEQETDAVWSDPQPLEEAHIDAAPTGPGVIALIHGGRHRPEVIVWADSTNDVRARLLDLVSEPQPQLARWLEDGELRFRAASLRDADKRKAVSERLMSQARRAQWPERLGS